MRSRGARPAAALLGPILLVCGSAVDAQSLGRLFTTPQQRQSLDEIRYDARTARPEPVPDPEPVAATPSPQPQEPIVSKLVINGVVKRSGGRSTVWVNGEQVRPGGVSRDGIAVNPSRRRARGVQIRLPSGTETIELKPGQKIDVATGAVVEAYEASPASDAPSAFPAASPVPRGSDEDVPLASPIEAPPAQAPPADSPVERVLRLLQGISTNPVPGASGPGIRGQ